jgi:hypothetical protein
MRGFKTFVLLAVAALCFTATTPKTSAQIRVGIGIGVEPACPYGYFDYAPYNCAPYGYYGPEWYNGGVFIGAGPWFHGHGHFRGHVDNHFDPRRGYNGNLPNRGDRMDDRYHSPAPDNFHGNERRTQHEQHR